MNEIITVLGSGLLVSLLGFAWYLSGRLTHIEDKLDVSTHDRKTLQDDLNRVEDKIDALPCHDCPITAPTPKR